MGLGCEAVGGPLGGALAWGPKNLWGQVVNGTVGGGPCWGLEPLFGGVGRA